MHSQQGGADHITILRPHLQISFDEALRQIAAGSTPRWRVILELMQLQCGTSSCWYVQGLHPKLINGGIIVAMNPDELLDDYPSIGCVGVRAATVLRDPAMRTYAILHDGVRGFPVMAAQLSRNLYRFALDRPSEYAESIDTLDGGVRPFIEAAERFHAGDDRMWFTEHRRADHE